MMSEKTLSRRKQSPWWEHILRGNRKDLLAQAVRRAAKLGSWGYEAGMRGHQIAYKRGWLKVRRLPQPTICVGNITVGGTGKTPLVIRLATDLLERGLRPAVLLRGYKRENVKRHPVLVRDAKRIRARVADAGDEAMELAIRLPGACVGVGADRHAVGKFVHESNPVDCFILDDGFQHHRLDRDINIVTLDTADPWGGGHLLPAGLLREPPEALRRADAVVLTRAGSVGPDRMTVLRAEVAQFMKDSSGLLESQHQPKELLHLPNRQPLPLSQLRGKRVLAVSGIGNPESFERTLTNLGARIRQAHRLPDHGGTPEQIWKWVQAQPKDFDAVVMTEKDAMRWCDAPLPALLKDKVFALRMNLEFLAGARYWGDLLDLIRKLSRGR